MKSDIALELCADSAPESDLKEISLLASKLLRDGVPEDAEIIYDGRNKLYTFTLPSGLRLNIKAFKPLGVLRGLIYGIFAKSKARKSLHNAVRLSQMGFLTPTPYACAEQRVWGGCRLKKAFYICRQLDDAQECRYWEKWPDRDDFVLALAAELSRIWDAGILFRDFSPGNVMLTSRKPYKFAYVDVNRIDFNVSSQRRLKSMFSRINQIPAETARLGRDFARVRGLDEAKWEDIALKSVSKLLKKKKMLHAIRDFFLRK